MANIAVGKIQDLGQYWREYAREYKKNIVSFGGKSGHKNFRVGAAGEYFVMAWALSRGIDVAQPANRQGEHDLFLWLGGQFRSVQVKVGPVNEKTGQIKLRVPRRRITSDLIAAVDLRNFRIRWISSTDAPIPEELL